MLLQSNYPPIITAEDYVMSGRYPHQAFSCCISGADRKSVLEAMEMTGCAAFRDKHVNRLSGGERQRVFIAMAIAQNTEYIFLDEPTTYLDINVGFEIMDLVTRLNRYLDKTIVMILHDLNFAFNYSHQVILMDSGKIVTCGRAEDMARNNKVEQVFRVRVKSFNDEGHSYYCFEKEN